MKGVRVCVFSLLFACSQAFAVVAPGAPVSFSFASIPVNDFAQATFRDMLGRDFVISSQLLALDKRVSMSVKGIQPSKLPAFVERVLASQGVQATERDGVYFLDLVEPGAVSAPGAVVPTAERDPVVVEPVEPVVLKLRHRSPVSMVELVNSVLGAQVARVAGGSAIVLSVKEDRVKSVKQLVEQLDDPVPAVEVKASFVEVARSDKATRGVSLLASAVSRRGLGVSLDPGTGSAVFRAGSYELVLDALQSDGRFRQVSRSRIVGDELERLSLSVGDETPTVGSSTKDQAGNLIQNIVYRPSGVLLDVVARVLGSGRVSLQLDGQVSAFQSTRTGVEGSPTLVKRQVKTVLSLDDGEVMVIGGLDDSKVEDNRAGFSFLPSSWSNKYQTNASTELLLVLTANILNK